MSEIPCLGKLLKFRVSLISHNYLGMEPSFYLFPIWNMVLNLQKSKWFLYDNRWCRQTFCIMDRLVWLRNLVGLLILLPWTLLRSLVVSYLMTQIWGCHFGHLQRLLEMVLEAHGTNLTLLRYIIWHLGTIYILKYYIKFSSYKFLHAHLCWNYLGKLQISEEEITFLTGGDDPYDDDVVLKQLSHPNLKLLLATEGAHGCRYYTKVGIHIF